MLLRLVISPLFQLRIVIRLKHCIYDFLSLKTICDLSRKTYWKQLRFWLKADITMLSCTLHNLASNSHMELISSPNCNPLEPLDLWLPKLQVHMLLPPRIHWEIITILSLIWHQCIAMDLKTRTSKNLFFLFNHHRISKRIFKIPSFYLAHHRWIQKTEIFTTIKISMLL